MRGPGRRDGPGTCRGHRARVKGSGTLTKQSQRAAKRRSASTGVTSFGGCYQYFINNVIILVKAGE